jgi:hypothetical protein
MILFEWYPPGHISHPMFAADVVVATIPLTSTGSTIGSALDRCMAQHKS